MGNFRFNRGRGGRGSDRKEMFKAVCDECGDECRVPFKPSNDKPIYCSECYEQHGGASSSNFDKGRRGRKFDRRERDSGRSKMHTAVCDECGKECQLPFKPTGDKPVFCSKCFEAKGGGSSRGGRDGGRKLSGPSVDSELLVSINDKLQTIIDLLSKDGVEEKAGVEEASVKEEKKEKEVKKEKKGKKNKDKKKKKVVKKKK